LKVIKLWKGHISGDITLVVYVTSCDIVIEKKGQKFRILLTGSDIFHAQQSLNGAAVSNLTIFNSEIDRIVGGPRPRTFAGFPGEEPAPRRARLTN
jgi:hypothetical protein